MKDRIKAIKDFIRNKATTHNESLVYNPNNENNLSKVRSLCKVFNIDNGEFVGYEVNRNRPDMDKLPYFVKTYKGE